MYASIILMNMITAMMKEPKATDPRWYLQQQYTNIKYNTMFLDLFRKYLS